MNREERQERRDVRRETRKSTGFRGMMQDAKGLMAKAGVLMDSFDDAELTEIMEELEDAAPKLLGMLEKLHALTEDITPEQIRELKAAVIEKLDHDGDGDVDLDDIPWPGWLRTAWGWVKRFLPGKRSDSSKDPSGGCETGS